MGLDELDDYLDRQGMETLNVPVDARIRVWFNEEMESRHFIVPGIIAIIIVVVIAIVGVLIALLLPAVQQAREAGRQYPLAQRDGLKAVSCVRGRVRMMLSRSVRSRYRSYRRCTSFT